MSTLALQGAALALLLLSLPLIVIAYSADVPALAVVGVVLATLGALTPPALRYVGPGSKEDE
ncbi:MAG TPA: hypothetical protein VM433_03845 [Mycobacteriales bacterium]|nr:hypothetical protein [Mycobacteriales bacterium]